MRSVARAELDELLLRLGEKIAADTRRDESPTLAKVIQLPLWPEATRAGQNPFMRSALFSTALPNARCYLDNELVGAVGKYEIRFKGKQLTQQHFDLYLEILHHKRGQPAGDKLGITRYALLKS